MKACVYMYSIGYVWLSSEGSHVANQLAHGPAAHQFLKKASIASQNVDEGVPDV